MHQKVQDTNKYMFKGVVNEHTSAPSTTAHTVLKYCSSTCFFLITVCNLKEEVPGHLYLIKYVLVAA